MLNVGATIPISACSYAKYAAHLPSSPSFNNLIMKNIVLMVKTLQIWRFLIEVVGPDMVLVL